MPETSKPAPPVAGKGGPFARVAIPFLLAFVAMLVHAHLNSGLSFRGDAYETWEVAKTLFSTDQPYRSYVEYRGFVLFALCAGIFELSAWLGTNDVATFRVFGALLFAALTTVSLPALFSRLMGRPSTMLRTLLFAAVVFYFFRGYFLYPSSDFLALYFLVLALNRVLAPGQSRLIGFGLAGLLIGAAILSRSNFVACLPFLVVLAWLQARAESLPRARVAAGLVALIAGVVAMYAINAGHGEYRSRIAGPEQTQGLRVLNAQLTHGLNIQKIEWSVDESYSGMVVFAEPVGRRIMAEEGITGRLELPQYLALVAKRPGDFLGIYVRHLFNGIDISYPSVYVTDVRQGRLVFSLFNYTLVFFGLLAALDRVAGPRRSLRAALGLACFVVPAAFCMAFPVEPRFFLGLLVTLHACAVLGGVQALPGLGRLGTRGQVLCTGLVYVAFVAMCLAVSARAATHIEGEALPLVPAGFGWGH